MAFYLLRSILFVALLSFGSAWALQNTKGTPLGGFGTGYVVFDAQSGDIAASGKVPPAASDGVSEFAAKKSSASGFYLFANGQGKKKATTTNEDAQCPLYTANFGAYGGVTFTLRAHGPFIPGDNPTHDSLAHSPLAYFEITAVNGGATAVDAAVAMEFSNTTGTTNLIGGADAGTNDATMNNKAISYAGTANTGNAYLMVDCDNAAATFSAGTEGAFLTSGTLTNGAGNIVAAKCNIPANGTARFKFVLSWWRTFISTADRYGSGHVDEENYFYHNYFADSKAAAQFGMAHFDAVSTGMTTMVSRIMASNFELWYKDRLLNNTYPQIHNSQCAKDGRVAFWEGHYPIIGTIDQAEHAALWYSFNWPSMQWRELQYWARTAHTGVGEEAALKGQIHHDFNSAPETWNDQAHFMCPWDDYKHADYWWVTNTTDWSDLNSMFIFKAYELMMATGNLDSIKTYFKYVKNSGDRIMVMSQQAGKHIPTESKSTYDNKNVITPQYACGVALAAYLAVAEIAKFVGEDSVATRYKNWYDLARAEYRTTCFTGEFGTNRDYAEGDVAGYSWAHYLGLPAVMDSDFVTTGCKRLWAYYSPLSNDRDKLGLWHFYTYDHWGGALIAIGKPDTALMVHKWDYNFYYTANPSMVFWQDLQKVNDSYASYMTGPCVWRSYFQMTGTLLDNANKRLWLRPILPSYMKDTLKNAPILNPKGWGTFNWCGTKNETTKLYQSMTVQFDLPVVIKEIILKNSTTVAAPGVSIKIGGAPQAIESITPEGSGFERTLRVKLANAITVTNEGVLINLYNGDVGIREEICYVAPARHVLAFKNNSIGAGLPMHFSIDAAGPVSMELIGVNGAKQGTLMNTTFAKTGEHSFVWNGRYLDGKRAASGMTIVRLRSSSRTTSKLVFIGK
jgi:hypothetical protein